MTNSRVSIKNVTFSEKFSEETNCFSCDVYFDNKKCGHAENQGHGGSTYAQRYPEKKELFDVAEDYCISLDDIDYGDFTLKSDIEHVVDGLFEEWLKARDLKKIMNKTKKALVYEIEGGYSFLTWGKYTIDMLMAQPGGRRAIKKAVDRLNKEGKIIINTNIDFKLLEDAK